MTSSPDNAHQGPKPSDSFELGGVSVARGASQTVNLPISRLSTGAETALPVRVIHGRKPGPVLFVSAGVHGDEIIGVEIIRRLIGKLHPRSLAGTVLCVPVVNTFGFIQHMRYLPDRRDLNRCFPGSPKGSLAGQLANVFRENIILRSDYGIDLHSAALHRTNFPQVRITDARPKAQDLALAFNPPAIITAPLRDGSLRKTAADADIDVLLFEAGEALRFDEYAIRVGVKGILNVLAHLAMIQRHAVAKARITPIQSRRTSWIRAVEGGIFRARKPAGAAVTKGEVLGYISDPFGDHDVPVESSLEGVIIGRTNLPVVNQGDALMHIAEVRTFATADERLNEMAEAVQLDPMFDEDEVI